MNSVHPGIVETEITRHMSFFNSSLSGAVLKPIIRIFLKNPDQGAQTTLYAALSPELENVTGKYFSYVLFMVFSLLLLIINMFR